MPVGNLFGNFIATPSQKFVDEFLRLTGVYLMASNERFYHHMMSAVQRAFVVDLVAIDDFFDCQDREYDSRWYTYRGKPCSMQQYVTLRFGEKAALMINYLLENLTDEKPFEHEFSYPGQDEGQ
jgi:hypothetical protein